MTALPGLTIPEGQPAIEWGQVLTATSTAVVVELDRWPGRRHGPFPLAARSYATAADHTHPPTAPAVGARVVVIGNPALPRPLNEAVAVVVEG